MEYCTRKVNCSRKKKHSGLCNKNRDTHDPFWLSSGTHKKMKLNIEISNLVENRDELAIQISTYENHQEEMDNSMHKLLMAKQDFELSKQDFELSKQDLEMSKQDLEVSKQELENDIAFALTVKENLEIELQSILCKLDQNKLINTRLAFAKGKREKTPTTWESINDSSCTRRYNRQRETKKMLEYIHGGSDGALFGAWDFLVKYARKELVEKCILAFKKGKFIEIGQLRILDRLLP